FFEPPVLPSGQCKSDFEFVRPDRAARGEFVGRAHDAIACESGVVSGIGGFMSSKAVLLVGMATVVCGQGIVTQKALSLGMAKTIAEGALAECKAKGYHTSVAVVDRAGQVMVILRDEQATAQTVEMSRRKAYTARMFRSTTLEFQKRTQE